MLTAARLRELLSYNPTTGVFRWRVTRGGRLAGARAGCIDRRNGYVVIRVGKVKYSAHQLAMLHATGEWPTLEIDHKNRRKADNRLCNLRQVSRRLNIINSAKIDRARGYEFHRGRYRRKVHRDGCWTYEYFESEAAAHALYEAMAGPLATHATERATRAIRRA